MTDHRGDRGSWATAAAEGGKHRARARRSGADGRDSADGYALRAFARLIPVLLTNTANPELKSTSVPGSGTEVVPPPPPPVPVVVPPPKPLLLARTPEQSMDTWFSINEVASCPANVTSPFRARALPQRSVAPGSRMMSVSARIFLSVFRWLRQPWNQTQWRLPDSRLSEPRHRLSCKKM